MNCCKVLFTVLILLNVSFQQALMAQPRPGHVIPVNEFQKQLIDQSTQRMENIKEIRKLLNNDLVQQEVGRLVGLEKVELALAALDDETLNELAIQSKEVNDQIEAGITTWGWIGIAVLAAIAILIISFIAVGLE